MVATITSAHTAPFLRWAGSKRQALHYLAPYWTNGRFSRYVEPFAGSASLFFYLAPPQALLGDINGDLIFTYAQVRDNLAPVLRALSRMAPGRTNYYRWRDRITVELDPAERAARFVYLNRFCFNGLYRTNRRGKFNVPYGGGKSGRLPSSEHLTACAKLLKAAKLNAVPYECTLQLARPGDFVYLDPPYTVRATRVFREYDPAAYDGIDLSELREHLIRLDNEGVAFVLSYYDCDEARILGRGFSSTSILVRRNIAGFASSRKLASELLISNCSPAQRL